MRKLQVISDLEDALSHIDEMLKRAKGEKSQCSIKNLEDSVLYIQTWVRYPIQKSLDEIKRKNA